MKKFLTLFFIFHIALNMKTFSADFQYKNTANTQYINKFLKTSSIIRNLDSYEPVPKELQNEYVKNISNENLIEYKKDMNKALKQLLNNKITYNNMTLEQMLLEFNQKSDEIFLKYLKNTKNKNQNKVYIEELHKMNGTISLFPNAIIENLQVVINKYNLNIEPGSESDIFLYKYFIEKYHLKYTKKFKELLELKEYTYTKINLYILEISNKI